MPPFGAAFAFPKPVEALWKQEGAKSFITLRKRGAVMVWRSGRGRGGVMDAFPPEVREVVPRNLRALVSQGAAIHSLGLHAFGFDFIAPINSEAISVMARGNALETLSPACVLCS